MAASPRIQPTAFSRLRLMRQPLVRQANFARKFCATRSQTALNGEDFYNRTLFGYTHSIPERRFADV